MRGAKFVKQLERALPAWVEQRFLSAKGAEDMLAFERERLGGGVPYLAVALSILGVLLLGSGIISFFAANWNWLPKIAKLAVLFGGMWGAYAVAGWLLGRGARPLVGEALLLLGVILFGANIWLIAQIYHISAHYPNGVLTWAAGALLAGYLLRSQPSTCAAVLLGILWTGMESSDFNRAVHWPYLMFWMVCLPVIARNRWHFAAHAAAAGLLLWSAFTLFQIESASRGALLYLLQVYFLVYLVLFLAGMLLERGKDTAEFAGLIRRHAGTAAIASLFMLTFPDLQRNQGWWPQGSGVPPAHAWIWAAATVAAFVAVLALAWWHRKSSPESSRPAYLDWGWALLAAIGALIFINVFARGAFPQIIAILFNLLFFSALVWLIYAGVAARDRSLVNTAFAFFALGILARYLDTFWTLLGRSYFFMGGGLVLIVAGVILERSRRRITRGIEGGAN